MSRLATYLIALLTISLAPLNSEAANRFARATGLWNAAIWSATSCVAGALTASTPGAADDATICAGNTVTLDSSRTANRVIINGSLATSTFTLTIDNTTPITINSGGSFSGNATINIDNSTTVVSGTATTIAFDSLTFNPSLGGNRTYTLAGGSVTSMSVSGDFFATPPSGGGTRSLTIAIGTLTTAGGGLTVGGTLKLDAGGDEIISMNTGGVAMSFGKMILGGTGTGTQTFTIANAAHTVTMTGTTGTLITRNTNGAFTFAGANGTVLVQPTAPADVQLNSSTLSFYNLTENNSAKTLTLGAAITVSNNLALTAGTLADGGNQITGNATGVLSATANGALTLGSAGTATTFPTNFTGANTSLNVASTVTYAAGVAQTAATTATQVINYGNLTFSGAGTKTTASGTLTVAGNWDASSTTALDTNNTIVSLTGNLTGTGSITQGTGLITGAGDWTNTGTFTGSSAGVTLTGAGKQITGPAAGITFTTLTVNGTYTNNNTNTGITVSTDLAGSGTLTQGTNGVLTLSGSSTITTLAASASPNTVTFNGSSAQTINASTYHHLTLNNSSGGTLGGNATVNGTLTFTSGALTTGLSNTLTMASTASTSGAGTSKHVVGNLLRAFSAATTFTYDIGDGTNYTKLQVTFTSGVTGNLTAAVTNTDHPNTTSAASGVDSAKSVNRYWTLKSSTITGTYSATFNYISGTPTDLDSGVTASNFGIRRGTTCTLSGASRTCTAWGGLTVSGTPTTTAATASGVTITSGDPESDFVIGEAVSSNFSREKQFIYTRELY